MVFIVKMISNGLLITFIILNILFHFHVFLVNNAFSVAEMLINSLS